MSMIINGVEYTTSKDLWDRSTLTQAEKDEIMRNVDAFGRRFEARQRRKAFWAKFWAKVFRRPKRTEVSLAPV